VIALIPFSTEFGEACAALLAVVGDRVTVADFVTAYTLEWGSEAGPMDGFPKLKEYVERTDARPKAALRIADAFAQLRSRGAVQVARPAGRTGGS